MGEVLRIETQQRRDAECIRDALSGHGADLDHDDLVVLIPDSGEGEMLTALLGLCTLALKSTRSHQ
jgi:hypothetical protein